MSGTDRTHVGAKLDDAEFDRFEEERRRLGLTKVQMLRRVVKQGLTKSEPGGLVTSLPPGGCNCVGFGHQVGCPSYAPKRSG